MKNTSDYSGANASFAFYKQEAGELYWNTGLIDHFADNLGKYGLRLRFQDFQDLCSAKHDSNRLIMKDARKRDVFYVYGHIGNQGIELVLHLFRKGGRNFLVPTTFDPMNEAKMAKRIFDHSHGSVKNSKR